MEYFTYLSPENACYSKTGGGKKKKSNLFNFLIIVIQSNQIVISNKAKHTGMKRPHQRLMAKLHLSPSSRRQAQLSSLMRQQQPAPPAQAILEFEPMGWAGGPISKKTGPCLRGRHRTLCHCGR